MGFNSNIPLQHLLLEVNLAFLSIQGLNNITACWSRGRFDGIAIPNSLRRVGSAAVFHRHAMRNTLTLGVRLHDAASKRPPAFSCYIACSPRVSRPGGQSPSGRREVRGRGFGERDGERHRGRAAVVGGIIPQELHNSTVKRRFAMHGQAMGAAAHVDPHPQHRQLVWSPWHDGAIDPGSRADRPARAGKIRVRVGTARRGPGHWSTGGGPVRSSRRIPRRGAVIVAP